jgi:7-cyano-7-deazaguanine synthase
MSKLEKRAIVVHSGGMDSSLCLAVAIKRFGVDAVLSVSFRYSQRHIDELLQAEYICKEWGVDHVVLGIDCLTQITDNALINPELEIRHEQGQPANTLVLGRNGLMARLAAIHAHSLGADCIYLGVIEVESANSGYRDCSREYMDLIQHVFQVDFDDVNFRIETPLIYMTKAKTMKLGHELGVLDFLLEHTITCYEGYRHAGCRECPACHLRNMGIIEFMQQQPDFSLPYDL